MNVYVADFETTTEKSYLKDGCTRVWASCCVTVEENPQVVHLSNNIDDFMEFVSKESCHVYMHNLKFDGEFILSWLFKNGYTFNREHHSKTFDVLISDMGQWYQLTVYIKKYNRKYLKTVFYDSVKKLPLSVKKIAKAFDLDVSKGEIDYDMYREIDHEITDEERDYIIKDCVIVAKALHHQFSEGLKKMTIGSDGLYDLKTTFGPTGWKYLFPTLPLEYDNDIRKAYRGGYCFVHEKFRNKRLHGISYDINSEYPAAMYGLYGPIPYGVPVKFEGEYVYDEKYPLYIVKISCHIKLKEGMLPTIQLKNNRLFTDNEYITDSKEIVDITLTSVDLDLMMKHYEVSNLEYIGGYKYKCSYTLFREFVDKWMKVKENNEGPKRTLAKFMLNTPYGKLATNPIRQSKIPIIDEEGNIKLVLDEPEEGKPVYTAAGCFITAYGRRTVINAAQENYDRFIYCDTDSISLYGYDEPDNIDIHPTKLGMWKNEGTFSDSKFLRPKTYIKRLNYCKYNENECGKLVPDLNTSNGVINVTCTGMPDYLKKDVTFDNFTYNSVFPGKLRFIRVKGGSIPIKIDFTIQPIKGLEVEIKSEEDYNEWLLKQFNVEDKLLKTTETIARKQYFCYKCGCEIHKNEHVKRVHIPPQYDRTIKKSKFYKPVTLCYDCEIHRLSEIKLYEEK